MGRARGTKRTRGSWPPELLDLQRRGGMAPDWHDTWHGPGGGMREVRSAKMFSPVFPQISSDDHAALRREEQDPLYRLSILEGYNEDALDGLHKADPLVESWWYQERLRVEGWFRRLGISGVPWKEIEPGWKEYFVRDTVQTLGTFDASLAYYSLLGYLLPSAAQSTNDPDRAVSKELSREIVQATERFAQTDPHDFRDFVQTELLLALSHRMHPLPEKNDLKLSEETFRSIVAAALPSLDYDPLEDIEGVVDFNKNEKNIFQLDFLRSLGTSIVPRKDIYPQGSHRQESSSLAAARNSALACAFDKYFERLSTRDDWDSAVHKILGSGWPEIRERLSEVYSDDQMQEYVARQLKKVEKYSSVFEGLCRGSEESRSFCKDQLLSGV